MDTGKYKQEENIQPTLHGMLHWATHYSTTNDNLKLFLCLPKALQELEARITTLEG